MASDLSTRDRQTTTARANIRPADFDVRNAEAPARTRPAHVATAMLVAPPLTVRRARSEQTKRIIDLLCSALALVALFPLLLLITVLLAVTTRSNPFFVQERIGRDARTFRCLKFRTMRPYSDEKFAGLLRSNHALRAEWERDQKLRKDPRITPLGRHLRSTNLDELPQLVNVLIGQMSLVGPRPIVLDEAGRYGVARNVVFSVRPGLTGLWQVSGRNALPYEKRVALDVAYVRNRTNLGDAGLILRTVQQTALAIVGRDSHGAF